LRYASYTRCRVPIRVAYLGPAGTFSEDALRAAVGEAEIAAVPAPTVYEAIRAVAEGEADRALVPFENSIEGAVRATLDTLAFEAPAVTIVGEHDHPIRNSLIAREALPLERIEVVLSHPQASAQCARFIREQLPGAVVRAAASTAEAVREVGATSEPWAALGAASAARIYGCAVLREGVEDSPDNVTRFVWIAPGSTRPAGDGPWRTTLVFSELGPDHPGALVEALSEFSSREVNLTRIESRPLRRGLGRYMFFIDIEGAAAEPAVAEAIEALRGKAESVRILGSYPIGVNGIPGL
jgi:prephenate dehydratase